MKKLTPRSEKVTVGTETIGTIEVKQNGCEAFGPQGQYLATFPKIEAARRALFDLHRNGEKGQASA